MTKQELNRDVKRLGKAFLELHLSDPDNEDKIFELRQELRRLYYADREFEYFNLKSIKILLRYNLKYRVIPLQNFGLSINELKL